MEVYIDDEKLLPYDIVGGGTIYSGIDVEYLKSIFLKNSNTKEENIANTRWLASYCEGIFLSYGTDMKIVRNVDITDDQSHSMMILLLTLTKLLDMKFTPPFRDFTSFKSVWITGNGYLKWEDRAKKVREVFDPLIEHLDDLEIDGDISTYSLVSPISPDEELGWTSVDTQIKHLRNDFRNAKEPQDYPTIGNDAVGVIDKLSATVYSRLESEELLGDISIPEGETRNRLRCYVEKKTEDGGESLQKFCKDTITFAQSVKHNRKTADRKKAGIAADAVIMLANILRRLDD